MISVEERARESGGESNDAIRSSVARVLSRRIFGKNPGRLLDLGCGTGALQPFVQEISESYVGVDAVRYPELAKDVEFHALDLNTGKVALPDASMDCVVSVEVIEHLENPRALMREMTRLCKPGGVVLVTTPNQLSWLSKGTFLFKNQFNAFQDASYPAHITALLEVDLRRIALECGLREIEFDYTCEGRIPGTAAFFPRWLSGIFPRQFSDNVLMSALK